MADLAEVDAFGDVIIEAAGHASEEAKKIAGESVFMRAFQAMVEHKDAWLSGYRHRFSRDHAPLTKPGVLVAIRGMSDEIICLGILLSANRKAGTKPSFKVLVVRPEFDKRGKSRVFRAGTVTCDEIFPVIP